jgi:4-diphosphocytidyl-2-C-methyl-D-erythritol kinase
MIVCPNAKINIGLNIIRKRDDGYHELSSVFYPVLDVYDVLEILPSDKFTFSSSGIEIPGEDNICEKAWKLLYDDFGIGNVKIHLHKQIPIGAGLGGGSADGAFMLKALSELFDLKLTNTELEKYALQLGADCPFFIDNTPKYVQGIGEKMTAFDLDLATYEIRLINPEIHISTKDAYSGVVPETPKLTVEKIIKLPINEWKNKLKNDFEKSVFEKYPQLKELKENLYNDGAIYASMSGSGSILFGVFRNQNF